MVGRIRAGDRQAEEALVERFSRGLLLMLRRLARDPSVAEDVHQETFRVVLEKARAGRIREPEKLSAFLRGTARNLLLAEGRQGARLRTADDATALAVSSPWGDRGGKTYAPSALPIGVAGEPPQLRKLLRQEEARLVRKLLGEMRFERDRQILVDFYLSERTKEEICAELGVAPGGFKKVLFRARERLRELWQREQKRQRFAEELR
ncbi:MAG: sigma-70 family RNA polymerase sigma factor [bacterium]|nr:sigma-70 family RNA polymerase sigma factor [bacterium]